MTKTVSARVLARMALGDAIHLPLHRAGIGVDVGDLDLAKSAKLVAGFAFGQIRPYLVGVSDESSIAASLMS
jgi:hypothetical protein